MKMMSQQIEINSPFAWPPAVFKEPRRHSWLYSVNHASWFKAQTWQYSEVVLGVIRATSCGNREPYDIRNWSQILLGVFFFEKHTMVLGFSLCSSVRNHSWLILWDHMWCWGLKLGQSHARQVPYTIVLAMNLGSYVCKTCTPNSLS